VRLEALPQGRESHCAQATWCAKPGLSQQQWELLSSLRTAREFAIFSCLDRPLGTSSSISPVFFIYTPSLYTPSAQLYRHTLLRASLALHPGAANCYL